MTKVLIHLGLPKTATTSLQHNVFQNLHDQGRINFLGKNLDYSDKTGKVIIHNYAGKFIRDAVEEKIPLSEARKLLLRHLDSNKLNVFSDEGIMVAYPGHDNLPLKQKLANLKELLKGYDVNVALTLRNPVDYFYSLYVQLYPDFYSQIKGLNTFEKYTQTLLSDVDNVLFESFFYDSYLPSIKESFDLELTYFEDLSKDKNSAYQVWARLLNLSFEEFKELFEKAHVNKKQKTDKGTKKIFSLRFVEIRARGLLIGIPFVFEIVKKAYVFFNVGILLNKRIMLNAVHKKPKGRDLDSLHSVFKVSNYRRG